MTDNVIDFSEIRKKVTPIFKGSFDAQVIKMHNMASDLDLVIVDALKNNMDHLDILGVLVSRLAQTIFALEKNDQKQYYEGMLKILEKEYEKAK